MQYVEQGDPDGVPMLLLHGYMDSWRTFEPLLPHLPSSIRAFAVTQRGHGDASRPLRGYDTQDFVLDIEAFLDALDLEAAVLVGASSGGFAARRFAIDRAERSLGLVLLGSPASLHDKPAVLELWETEIAKLSDPIDPDFVRAFHAGTVEKQVPAAFLDAMVGESLKVPARVWISVLEGLLKDASAAELSDVGVRTLVLSGEEDAIVPYGDQVSMASAIADSRLVVIPGAGHSVYWEEPERVALELTRFVEGLASVGGS